MIEKMILSLIINIYYTGLDKMEVPRSLPKRKMRVMNTFFLLDDSRIILLIDPWKNQEALDI